jgi:hypothetical protein
MADYASEGGRWYRPDGTPCHTVIGKNGKERNATLLDARKMGLLPSVTSLIACAAKPGLELWKQKQIFMAVATLARNPAWSDEEWWQAVLADSREQAKKAADRGTAIHGAIERFFGEGFVPLEWEPWIQVVNQAVYTACGPQQWAAERSFSHPLGYGGKTDLHSPEWLVDVKTKDGDLTDCKIWDEHEMQLGAYRFGLNINKARCGILFVSRTEVAARFMEVDETALQRGMKMFDALLYFWQAKTGYMPRVAFSAVAA